MTGVVDEATVRALRPTPAPAPVEPPVPPIVVNADPPVTPAPAPGLVVPPAGTYAGVELDARQTTVAAAIVSTVYACGGTDRDAVRALACAAQESRLLVLANDGGDKFGRLSPEQRAYVARESLALPHHGVGSDAASVGVMQQQPLLVPPRDPTPARPQGWGWGSVAQCMDVTYSTAAFVSRLLAIADRDTRPLTDVVQQVQRSSHPGRYAVDESLTVALRAAIKPAPVPPLVATRAAYLHTRVGDLPGATPGPVGWHDVAAGIPEEIAA